MTFEEAQTLKIGDRLTYTGLGSRNVYVLSREGVRASNGTLLSSKEASHSPVLWVYHEGGSPGSDETYGRLAAWVLIEPSLADLDCGEDPGL